MSLTEGKRVLDSLAENGFVELDVAVDRSPEHLVNEIRNLGLECTVLTPAPEAMAK